jgi:hypothetical protein
MIRVRVRDRTGSRFRVNIITVSDGIWTGVGVRLY